MAWATSSLPVPVSPQDEHGRIRRRHLLHLAQDLLDGGALPGDLAVRLDHVDLGLQVVALRLQPVLQALDLLVGPAQRLLGLPPLRDVAQDAVRLQRAARRHRGSRRGPRGGTTSPRGSGAGSGTRRRAAAASRRAAAASGPAPAGGRPDAGARSRTRRGRAPPPARREGRRGRGTGRRRRRDAGRSPPRSSPGRRGRRPPRRRASLSSSFSSWRFRASALVKTCATSWSRFTRASGQSRSACSVLRPSMPTGGSPPTEEREGQVRLDAEKAAVLPVDGGLRRQIVERGDHDPSAGRHLLRVPGELLLAQRLGRPETRLGAVEVRGREVRRSGHRPLPEHRQVDAEEARRRGAGRPRSRGRPRPAAG